MPKTLTILLDQNIPSITTSWLQDLKPHWKIYHVNEVDLAGALVIIDRTRIRIRTRK